MECGVLYLASGREYIDQAITSAASVKRHHEDLPITIYTDHRINADVFDTVRTLDESITHMGESLLNSDQIPYERTLYLDADTLVCADISGVFDMLDRVDIALAHDEARTRWPRALYDRNDIEIPHAFTEFNTGVMAFRDAPVVEELFQRWDEYYESFHWDLSDPTADGGPNQPSLRLALWEHDIDIGTLLPEYNVMLHTSGRFSGPVRILHAGLSDTNLAEFEKCINRTVDTRVAILDEEPCRVIRDEPYQRSNLDEVKIDRKSVFRTFGPDDVGIVAANVETDRLGGSPEDVRGDVNPVVSVIIPTRDMDEHLERAIDSLCEQTLQRFEVLVVDNGSKERTLLIVEGYDDHRLEYLPLAEPSGYSAAINHGLEHANAPFVSILEPDSEYHPKRLAITADVLDRQPERVAGVSHSFHRMTGPRNTRPENVPAKELSFADMAQADQIMGGSNTLYRRDALEEIGGWDDNLHTRTHFDVQLRLLDASTLAGIVNALSIHDVAGEQAQPTVPERRAGLERLLEKHGPALAPTMRASLHDELVTLCRTMGDTEDARIHRSLNRLNQGRQALTRSSKRGDQRAQGRFADALAIAPDHKSGQLHRQIADAYWDAGQRSRAGKHLRDAIDYEGIGSLSFTELARFTRSTLSHGSSEADREHDNAEWSRLGGVPWRE